MAVLTPTREQQDVLDALRGYFEAKFGPGGYHNIYSLFLSAVAGAGKTSTIKMICRLLAEIEQEYGVDLEACSLSFNRIIAIQGNAALETEGLKQICKTTNSLGFGILKEAARQGQCREPKRLNKKKYTGLAERYIKKNRRTIPTVPFKSRISENDLASKIAKLASAARLTYCDASSAHELAEIILHYPDIRIDLTSPYWPFIYRAIDPIIQEGIALYNGAGEWDFDDQIFLPLALNLAAPTFDFIAIDEAQDLNKVRTELIMRSIKPNGALFFVGDRRQAIQGFAYADTDSVNNIIRDTQAIEKPLTCCWRCDENIIRLAQAINPDIKARPGAPKGTIEIVDNDFVKSLQAGYYRPAGSVIDEETGEVQDQPVLKVDADMVLCRVTADLVSNCLAAIRNGILAIVRGKDIGANIIKKIDEICEDDPEAEDLTQLVKVARQYYRDYAIALANDDNAEDELAKLGDQIDTIEALLTGFWLTEPKRSDQNLNAFKIFVDSKFADDEKNPDAEGPRPVIFSTIHKAKGLETDRVFIIRPDLMPHPAALKAGKDWQLEQEENIAYVAVTRPKRELYFVGGVPDYFSGVYAEILEEQEALNAAAIAEAEQIFTVKVTEEQDEAPIALIKAPASQPEKRGRKALAAADKPSKIEAFVDPDIKRTFSAFVEMLQDLDADQLKEVLPGQEMTVTPSGQLVPKKVSGADVIEAALMAFAPFRAYLETSEQYSGYVDRRERQQTAREAYKGRKKKAKAAPVIDDEEPGPEDDGPNGGSGQPAPSPFIEDEHPDAFDQFFEDDLAERSSWPVVPYSPSLFNELPEVKRKVERIFYFCPRCKRHWYADYYVTTDGQRYREENGQIIYAVNDFLHCPFHCGNEKRYFRKTIFKHRHSVVGKCDSRCWNAKPGSPCTCVCGGARHGLGSESSTIQVQGIGQSLLQFGANNDDAEA